MPLFTPGHAEDPTYVSLRDSPHPRNAEIRARCEALWQIYEPFADEHFLIEIRRDFHARYWEMYLTVTLRQLGYETAHPKPGPDAGIVVEGQRIWLEAVAPKPGDGADAVPKPVSGQAVPVPNEQIVLRYLNSISAKLAQHQQWLEAGNVARCDALIVAINPRYIDLDWLDAIPPRIVQAAFPIGSPFVSVDPGTHKVVGEGYHSRHAITKASGKDVPTGAFLLPVGASLSGLLCSRVDCANGPAQLGDDFQLVPNPLARVLLPASFRLPGTYFPVAQEGDDLVVTLR